MIREQLILLHSLLTEFELVVGANIASGKDLESIAESIVDVQSCVEDFVQSYEANI